MNVQSNNALERSCGRRGRAVLAMDGVLAGRNGRGAGPLNSIVRWQ
jgi:hypothetical protein